MKLVPISGEAPQSLVDIIQERKRQVEKEGWTLEHDASHDAGELATAGATYALNAARMLSAGKPLAESGTPPALWPWCANWWKPKEPRRDLVRAAALILAEIDRMDALAEIAQSKGAS